MSMKDKSQIFSFQSATLTLHKIRASSRTVDAKQWPCSIMSGTESGVRCRAERTNFDCCWMVPMAHNALATRQHRVVKSRQQLMLMV